MSQDRFSALLAKKMTGEATPEELRELQDYLQRHAGEQYFADLFQTFWASGSGRPGQHDPGSEAHFQDILRKAAGPASGEDEPAAGETVRRRFGGYRIARVAAAALAVVALAWTFWPWANRGRSVRSDTNEIVIQRGAKSKVILPDGSQVWLNSDSKLSYPGQFSDSLREVSLEGEGYFIVKKDAAKPFIVHTPDINIHVLGTVFNVKSYAGDATVETTLLRGAIAVEKRNTPGAARIVLRPREKLVIQKQEETVPAPATGSDRTANPPSAKTPAPVPPQHLSVTLLPQNLPDSVITETSWVYGRLVFEGDRFHELALKMERWYNKKISIRNDKVANYRFTGMFENETLEEALRALQLTAPFRFRIDGNDVFIDKP